MNKVGKNCFAVLAACGCLFAETGSGLDATAHVVALGATAHEPMKVVDAGMLVVPQTPAPSEAPKPNPAATADAIPPAPEQIRYMVLKDRRTGRLMRRAVPVLPLSAKPASGRSFDGLVNSAAEQYQVDPALVHAVIAVESNYNPYAVSPVGAQGLMQLMPATAKQLGVSNAFNAEENIRAGVRHLKELQRRYNGDNRLALAAYNAGAGAVKKYGWIPPYRETQDYVYKVGKRYGDAQRLAGTSKVKPAQPAKAVSEPEHRPVEHYVDSDGRIHLRTK